MAPTPDEIRYRALRPVSDPTSFYPPRHPETVLLRQGTTYGPAGFAPLGSRWHGGRRALPVDVELVRDVSVKLRDGSVIYADIFRPPGQRNLPAIVAWSPYGKQGGYWNYGKGNLGAVPPLKWVSGLQKFEGPDPAEWVAHGYAVVHPDPPGAFGSPGKLRTWGKPEGRHVYDMVEWLAEQDWCSGRVGMAGNSWLTISQWFGAAERPPHLAAIAPWNGFFDVYDFVAPGGIPSPQFAELLTDFQWGSRMEWLPAMIRRFPRKNAYWDEHEAALENIEIPAYVAHALPVGVHKWTPEAFRRLGSRDKWLRLCNTHEWYDLYTPEYVADLRRFFDRYLKGIDNGWEETPRVRVCVLDPGLPKSASANAQYADSKGYVPAVTVDRPEAEWPLARTRYTKLHLGDQALLTEAAPAAAQSVRYRARTGSASFTYTFAEDTELTGYAVANLWFEASGSTDADLFVELSKLSARGRRLGLFEASSLRVSHRELDPSRSQPFLPCHTHRKEELLAPGERVRVSIGFAPTAMLFRRGEKLSLRISGTALRWLRDPTGGTLGGVAANILAPVPVRNRGTHVIHYGGDCDSYVQLPVVPLRHPF